MSKMSKQVARMHEDNILRLDETTKNFMGGDSYTINPLDTLKMISASSIFGEPQYYRQSKSRNSYAVDALIREYSIIPIIYEGKCTDDIFTAAIDAALEYDYIGTMMWAIELRTKYMMRLNPQIIMVRAAIHPLRKEFTEETCGMFHDINKQVMLRADDSMIQMSYYLYLNKGKKNNVPSILKRSWAKHLSGLNRYGVNKYKNHEIGMINAVRISHANSAVINELMRTGTVEITEDQSTWENLRSAGKSWGYITSNCDMGHMAMLRNLRGVFTEIEDSYFCDAYLSKLKRGVPSGKQFPFRYWSAIKAIEKESKVNHRSMIIDALEECMDIATDNFPKLSGKTMCLSDNSGSAWNAFNSEYGSVTVAEIDNLSSVITAACSDEGYVGKFGDRLSITPISKRRGILDQTSRITSNRYSDVGGNTEGGIWEFFYNAIEKKEHWDNIFIYSDQQAGHGGLYGTDSQKRKYKSLGYSCSREGYSFYSSGMINVFKLVQDYRKKVNPKVNVFMVQTAGYDNVLIPEYAYRTNIMYGWTGKEALFAKAMIDQWDEIENRNESQRRSKQ
jgi:hypothetical protein